MLPQSLAIPVWMVRLMSSKPHDDLPTLFDRLNWNDELTRLCESIEHCTPPHVFGVHGDWGSGKTSFMRQLQWRLGGEATKEDGSVGSDSMNFGGTQDQLTTYYSARDTQQEDRHDLVRSLALPERGGARGGTAP